MKDIILTKQELWHQQAPSWNFELDQNELLQKGLDVGFVSEISEGLYLVNPNYGA